MYWVTPITKEYCSLLHEKQTYVVVKGIDTQIEYAVDYRTLGNTWRRKRKLPVNRKVV